MTNKKSEISFEDAFTTLESILEKLNTGGISLDDSLNLYEEAAKLIIYCEKKLTSAEKKVEILVKQRNGELLMDSEETPQTKSFVNEKTSN